ncbi:MAG: hypothetical protein WC711_00205 [Candidatus Staskawiczbacteria bacterium]|jgi:hypothetical protein
MKKIQVITLIIIIIIIIAGGSFYGGMMYGKNKNSNLGPNGSNFQTRINRPGDNGSNFILGEILSKEGDNIILKLLNNAGSKIIFYSESTQINKQAIGNAEDLGVGTLVSVTGTTNSDGSITAQSIQIRPAGENKPKL